MSQTVMVVRLASFMTMIVKARVMAIKGIIMFDRICMECYWYVIVEGSDDIYHG